MPGFKAPAGVGFRRPSGKTGPEEARRILAVLGKLIPHIMGVDVGHWYATGGAAWLWQPRIALVGAFLLRTLAFNTARRDPVGAIWMAATALAIDTATWVFVGMRLSGIGFSPEEGAALVTLLKVEGGVLLGLFFLLAPPAKRNSARPTLTSTEADRRADLTLRHLRA